MGDTPHHDRADERLSILPLRLHRLMLLLIALVLVGLDLARLTGLWPCDIACQGGAHYQAIAGVSVIWPALAAHLLLLLLTGCDVLRGRSTVWTVRLVLLLVGVSLFFLSIAHRLELSCAYCQGVHGLTIAAILLIIPLATRPWESLWLPLMGWLAFNAVFHHAPVADVATAGGPRVAPVDVDASLAANRGRTYGDPAATRTLEVVIDLTCRHCAEQYRPLMAALAPALAAKRVRVVVRHLVRPSQGASTPAAELALAAAVLGEHAAALEVLLGSNPDAGLAGLTARVGEVVDPAKLDAVLARDVETIRTVLADDQGRVALLGIGARTPSAVLLEDGKVTRRWVGDLPVGAITAALDGAL
jgi:hypothetical protein